MSKVSKRSNLFIPAIILLAVLGFMFYFFSPSEDVSVTGRVLPSAPTDASVLDMYIQNVSMRIDGAPRQFTALRFVAFGGGKFTLPGVSMRLNQFYVVLANRSVNGGPYVGKIIYNGVSGWTSFSSTTTGVSSFSYVVTFNTSNRTAARRPLSRIRISGLISGLLSSGAVNIEDGSNGTQQGNWSVDFSRNGFGSTDQNLNRTHAYGGSAPRTISYILSPVATAPIYLLVPRGFISPAEVSLTDLNQFELRLVERANAAATSFSFSCSDPDGSDAYTPGVLSLVYTARTVDLYPDTCILNTTTPLRYSNIEGTCASSTLPSSYSPSSICSGSCNSAGTACAS